MNFVSNHHPFLNFTELIASAWLTTCNMSAHVRARKEDAPPYSRANLAAPAVALAPPWVRWVAVWAWAAAAPTMEAYPS